MGYVLAQDGSRVLDQAGAGVLDQAGGAAAAAFPDPGAQLGIRLELNAGGTWTDVTSDCDHGPWVIGRGHPDESTTVAPSTFEAQLTNTAARYSPDNVMSDLWPWCVQNMPGRASIPAAVNYLRLEAGNSDRAFVQDATALHVTGSVDLRIALRLSDWQGCVLAARMDAATPSWYWTLLGDGTLAFSWWDSGGTLRSQASDAPLSFPAGDFAVRVTLDATNGTLTFYTGTTVSGTWTQLGDAFATTGGAATSVRAGNAPLVIGFSFSGGLGVASTQLLGRVYEFELLSGIGGSAVADGQFGAQAAGATSWTGADGLAWNVAGGAEISDRDYRLHFESSEWPQEEPVYNPDKSNDTSVAVDALVPLAGGGLLRRLSQRAPNVSSAMYRAILAQAGSLYPVAYVPMQDSAGSSQFGAAIGPNPMTWAGGPPVLAANSQDFACSDPLPTTGGAPLHWQIPPYPGGAPWSVSFLADLTTLPGSNQVFIQLNLTGGLAAYVVMVVDSDGTVAITASDASLNVIADTGPVSVLGGLPGGIQQPLQWTMQAAQSGGNVKYTLGAVAPGQSIGFAASATSTAAGAPGNVGWWFCDPYGGNFSDTVIGHVFVQAAAPSIFALGGALAAHAGEAAGIRFARLCAENGITCRTRGNLADTTPMGAQPAGTLAALLQACADADQGTWTELRQVLGWGFITRKAQYNQAAAATASYTSDHLSPWPAAPARDDQVIVNDVTFTNDSGSSYRMFAAPGQPIPGGRMSTAAPGSGGVGTYAQPYSASLASDAQLPDVTGWKLHIGTVDQARLPGITVDLANTAAAGIYNAVLAMDLGDRLVISSPPRRLGFEPVTQLAQAITETLWYDTLTIAVAGVPELPWEVVQLDAGMHLAPPAAVLSSGVTSSATSWSVAASSADSTALFSTSAGDYPQSWVVDGERVTVGGVSGSSSPQTASPVTRSANGVIKSHLANAVITAWPPPAIGL